MRLKLKSFAKFLMIASAIISLFSISLKAQKATSIVLCNEKESFRVNVSYPRESTRYNGENFAAWHYLLDDAKGKYEFSLSSPSNFTIGVLQRIGRNGKWTVLNKNNSQPSLVKNMRGANYVWNSLRINQTSTQRENTEIYVRVKPTGSFQDFVGSWYTSGCENSKPDTIIIDNSCKWVGGGIFGLTMECRCGGVVSPASKCGKRP